MREGKEPNEVCEIRALPGSAYVPERLQHTMGSAPRWSLELSTRGGIAMELAGGVTSIAADHWKLSAGKVSSPRNYCIGAKPSEPDFPCIAWAAPSAPSNDVTKLSQCD